MTTIRGSVFQDLNGNGIFDVGEGLPNVTLFLDVNGNGIPDEGEPITSTDINGEYIFTGLPEGSFVLSQVTPPGFLQPIGVPQPLATTGNPEERIDINILNTTAVIPPDAPPVFTTGNIRGAVFVDNNRNLIYEPLGEFGEPTLAEGFPRATVYIDLNNSGFREPNEPSFRTNEAGFFQFELLPPGSYLIRTELPSGFERVGDNPIVAQVNAGSVTNLDIGVINPNSIYGRVIRDLNGNAQPEPAEPGQGGIGVTVTDSNGRVRTATTNDNGFFIVTDLDTTIPGSNDPQNPFAQFVSRTQPERFANSFVVEFDVPSDAYIFTSPTPPLGGVPGEIGVTVPPEQSRQINSTLVFSPAGAALPVPNSISGVVFNDLNANSLLDVDPITGITDPPLRGATVFLDLNNDGVLGSNEPRTTTDFNGNFIFTNLDPTLPIDPLTGFAAAEDAYVVRVQPTDIQDNLTTPVPVISLASGEAAQVALGLSSAVPFQPTNQFAEVGGGINEDALIPVRGFDPIVFGGPTPVQPPIFTPIV